MANKSEETKLSEAIYLLEKKGYTITAPNYFRCIKSGKELSMKQNNFYQTSVPLYAGCIAKTDNGDVNVLPVCKSELEKMYNGFLIETKNNQKLSMYKLTQELRLPWNEKLWEMAEASKTDNYKVYIGKMNSMPQFSYLEMSDSEPYVGDIASTFEEDKKILEATKMKKSDKKEAVIRWGDMWNELELQRLEEFYHSMREVNKIDTPQDEDYLRKLARLSVRIDGSIEKGETQQAKQFGDLYSKYMSDSKFRAMDMTDADKQGGIKTFSQIFEEVERPDFIPPWKKYADALGVGQDVVDKAIMHIENFTLKFKGMEKMISPPNDTPKLEEGESDGELE